MQDPPDSPDYSRGFAGPTGGRVDFTQVGEPDTTIAIANEEREVMRRMEEYMNQRGSTLPAASTAAALDVARKFVRFNRKGNEVWGSYEGKSFVRSQLIDRLCDFFSYSIELAKRLDEKKKYMMYPEAQQLSLDIFFVGTVLASLTKPESAQLYEALNSMLEFKRTERKLKLGDGPLTMEVIIDSDAFLEGYNPSPGRIRTKVPRVTSRMREALKNDI